jgi:hypothetical protein
MTLPPTLKIRLATQALLLAGGLLLGACAGAGPGAAGTSAEAAAPIAPEPAALPPPPMAVPSAASAAAPSTSPPPQGSSAQAASASPAAAAGAMPVTPAASALIGALDLSCKTAADCSIKDVGSCCGYQPRCVNKNAPTYPEQVKAKCAQEGRVSHCGMPTVTGCECLSGKCANLGAADAGLVQ